MFLMKFINLNLNFKKDLKNFLFHLNQINIIFLFESKIINLNNPIQNYSFIVLYSHYFLIKINKYHIIFLK